MNKEKQFLVESLGKELIEMLMSDYGWDSVSYTHLTLPTNREV